MMQTVLINNLWVLVAALLVFTMTISVGFLEIGELGHRMDRSLYKTLIITGFALFFMGLIGFNIAFAPTVGGVIGNPFYSNSILGIGNPFVSLKNFLPVIDLFQILIHHQTSSKFFGIM